MERCEGQKTSRSRFSSNPSLGREMDPNHFGSHLCYLYDRVLFVVPYVIHHAAAAISFQFFVRLSVTRIEKKKNMFLLSECCIIYESVYSFCVKNAVFAALSALITSALEPVSKQAFYTGMFIPAPSRTPRAARCNIQEILCALIHRMDLLPLLSPLPLSPRPASGEPLTNGSAISSKGETRARLVCVDSKIK